jgi:two-component system nitrate/nitrite response regulator NarL
MNTLYTLLMIDDHPLFRRGVLQLLSERTDFKTVGEASSGAEGLKLAAELNPDIILLDLNMRDMNGIEVLKQIKASESEAKVVMLTVSDDAVDLVAALRAGADGYLLKEMDPDDLCSKLKRVASGDVILSGRLTQLLAHAMREQNSPRPPDEAGLTEQERRILEHIAQGKSNKLIARELDISDGTVKVHVKHLLRKLNLHSRLEAAVWVAASQKRAN